MPLPPRMEARRHVARGGINFGNCSNVHVVLAPIPMPSTLRINYLILDEPNPDMFRYITIDSNKTVQDLRKAIELKHQLAAGQIAKLERVTFSLDDQAIDEKLRKFTFTSTANTWRATTKLAAVIVPADLAPDHLHLIIRA
jgi:hypothetical protein